MCQLILCSLLLSAAQAANLVQSFYLPMPEAQIYQANSTIISGTSSTINSTFSIVVTGDGTVIYYDQWEDGYETDLANPTQPTTQIWGDGNDAHGIPPGFAHNPLGLPAGTVIALTNVVILPRNPSTILWDARDRVASTKALVISRAAWPVNPGPVFAGAVGVLSTMDYGTNYISPVGQDITNVALFKYVGVFVMAAQNNTAITIDPNGNGVGTTNFVLNQGESYLVNGGIKKGGRITSSKPVQADLLIGHTGAAYASDWFTLYPVEQWSSTYYTPVGTAASGNPAYVYLYNPNTNAIVINYNTQSGSGSFSIPGTNGVFQFQMPVGSGGSFVSAGGQNFFALSTVGANPASDTAFNWGFTLVPQAALTTEAVVGWGPGSADGTVDGSPAWITPLAATRIYVDYQGDHAGPLIDPNGNHYDTNYDLVTLQSKKIYDPTKNQTGMRVYTIDGTPITAAWGEDPDVASPGNPYIDAGTTVLPFPVPFLKKTATIINDVGPTNLSVGDTIAYTVEVDNKGLLPLGNTLVIDAPSTNLLYVTNSTTYDGGAIPDSVSGTPFPLDAPGYTIPVILSRGTSTFTYQCKVVAAGSISNSINIGGTGIYSETSLAPAPPSGASCNLNFTDAGGGQIGLYSVGANIYVAMTNAAANTASNSIQTIILTVQNLTHGDVENIVLTETDTNSGVFRCPNGLPTSASAGLAQQDSTLNVGANDLISVSYTDPNYGDNCSANAMMMVPARTKQLYLSVNNSTNGTQALNRVDPVAYAHSPTHTSVDLALNAVNVDATNSGTTGATSATNLVVSHTTGTGANRLMLVTVTIGDSVDASGQPIPNVSSVIYGGQALTFVGGAVDSTPAVRTEIWKLLNPNSGTTNVVVTLTNSLPIAVGVTTFINVDQTTPLGTFVSASSVGTAPANRPSVNSTSASGELVYASVGIDGDGSGTPPPTPTIGAGQNQLWSQFAQNRIYGASSVQNGAASVTNSWTWAGNAQQWTIAAVPIKPASGASTNVTTFILSQALCSNFVMPSNNFVYITNFITVTNGVMPTNPIITATLQANGANILTLTNPTYSAAASNLVWSGALTANLTIQAGQFISYVISNGQAGTAFHIDYDSTNKPSQIVLPASTVISINTLGVYDAPYPGGSLVTTPVAGSRLYVRADVADPFGSYDITGLGLVITAPIASANISTGLNDTNVVADSGCMKTYEYVWNAGTTTGNYAITATANEGTEGVTAAFGASLSLIFLDLGTPSSTEFTSGDNGVATNSYPANAAGSVCVLITDLNRNTNATSKQMIIATLTSSAGDSEIITLLETATNSGDFTACLATSTNSGAAPNDLTLYAPAGSVLTVNYNDPTDPSDHSSATGIIKPSPGLPGVAINKTLVSPNVNQVSVGQSLTYNLQVINTGSTTLNNVSVTDNFPPAKLTYASASKFPTTITSSSLTWTNVGSLTPGQSTNFTATFTAAAAGNGTNSATVNGGTVTNNSSVVTLITHAALTVTKTLLTPTNTPVGIGSNVVFRITVQNTGDTTVTTLPFEDTYSGVYYQYVSATIVPDGQGAGSLIWTNLNGGVPFTTNSIITNDVTMLVIGQGNPAANTAVADYATDIFGNLVPTASSTISVTTIAGTISGQVYNDKDKSGSLTIGDVGLDGVTLNLYTDPNSDGNPEDGTLVQVTTTDVRGYYEFLNLYAGQYVVVKNSLPGYGSVAPTSSRLAVNLPTLVTVGTNNFFDYQPSAGSYSTVSGKVWNDANGNGTNDPSEVGLAYVSLDLVLDVNTNGLADLGESVVASATTDAGGNYSFAGIPPGNYVVRESDLYGYYSTGDAQAPNDSFVPIIANGGALFTNIWFLQHLNQAPTATNDLASVTENTTATLYPLINDFDPDGNQLTITTVTTTNGSVSFVSATNILFTPGSNYLGTATLAYTVTDGHGGTSSAIIVVTVTNIPPLANPDGYAVLENSTNTFSPLTNDIVQTPGGRLAIISVAPSSGTATINGTNVIFTPALNFSGIVTISYAVIDQIGGTNSAIITVNVSPVADVAVTLSGPTNVFAGSNYTYTVTISNAGPATASNVITSDVLPNNVVFVSASSGGTTNLGTVIWSVGALLSGGSTNLSFMVTAPLSGNVTNGSTVTASTTDLNLANNSSSLLVTTVTPVADIAVTSSGTNLVYAGGTVVYTVTVTNLGITSASNVIISDIFPTNATFFSASDSGSTNNGLVTWPVIPVMTNGQVVSFTITIFAPYSGTLTNTVLGLSPTFDPFTANNDGSAPAATTFTAVIPVADLGVGKSAPAVVFAAGSLAYTISVTNFGPSSADGVTVADIPPTGVTFASATGGGQIINNVAVWTFGTLTSGQVSNVTLTVMAPISGALTNVASAGSTTLDTNLNNNVSLPVVTLITNIPPIANPDTYIVAEDSTNTFIPLGNDTLQTPTGNLTIIGVTTTNGSISFTPTNVTFVPALNYVGNVTIGYTITDNVGGTNSSFIFVTFTNLAPTALPQTTAITENTSVGLTLTGNDPANKLLTFIIVNAPTNGSLTLVNTNTGAVTYLPNTNYVGLDSFTFRVNNGSYKSPTATVSIAVTNIAPVANPDGYTILENSTNTFSPLTNDLALTPGGLLAILNVTTTNGVATVSGTSIIFALTNNYTGPTTLSYTITDGIGGTNSSFITVHVLPVADVAVSKSGPGIVFAATNFNYTITVTNLGPGTATSLSVTDTLPTTVTLVSSTAGATLVACQLIWTNLGSLTSGTATNLTVTVTAPLASLSLTNVASGGSPTIDSNPTNNTSLPVFTSVTPIADVSVSKSGPAGIIFGTNFNYTITVTNAGPSVATTLSITDSLPAGLTFISSLPATTTNAINQVIWSNFGDLAPGTSTNLTLTVISTVRGSLTNLASGGGPILDLTPTNNFSPPVVTAVTNYPPLANPDSYTLSQNSSRIMFPLLNDVVRTPGGSLNLISVTSTNGNVTFNATNLTYTATNDYIGTTTIAYSIIDNVGGTNSSFITVTVTNITPIATPQAVTTFENTSLPIILTGTDPANHPLTFIITVAPTNGVLTLLNTNTGTLTYVPNTNYTGADSFAFRVNNGLVIGTNAIVAITVVPVADLLVAEFGPISGVAGSNLTYTVAITNLGPATVTNLIVTNQLPAGFTFVTNSGPGLFANGQVTWTIPILAANANTNFTFTVFAAEGGTYSNRAMGLSGTVDLNLTNNNGSASNALVRTAISALADVSVFKDGGTNVFAGQTVDYVITATNAGPSTATSVVVQDMLPAGAIFQNASGSYALSNGIVTWPGVTLAPNAATTFNVTLLAPASATSFLNVAQGNSPVADPNPTNNNGTISKARVTTKVVPSADVIVLLSAPATSILGSNFVYSLVVSNAGPSVSSNIVVSDSFPSNLVFVAASGGGSFTNSLVTWPKVVSLAVGSWTNYTVTAKGSNSGDFINIASALAATADPNPINNSGISPASQAETIVAPAQFNFLIGTPVFNPQTGLYEEAVTVTNTGVVTIAGFRLYVGGLRSGVSLYNANGTNNGLAFVQYNFALDPSNHVGLILEFYNPSRLAFTNTVTAEAILPPDTSTNGTNGSVLINRIFPDNRFVPARVVIEFGSVPGKNYTILYSTNLTSSVWKVATPTVTANANVTQWYDDGPPKTDSKPGGVRYYRIIKN